MSMTFAELRAEHRWCPTCEQETLPMRNGSCGFCDRQLEGVAPLPPLAPAPPAHIEGQCRFCGDELGPPRNRLYCNPACKQSYWVRYTPAGRAWVKTQNDRRYIA